MRRCVLCSLIHNVTEEKIENLEVLNKCCIDLFWK